ncbi:cysteine hydrolase family protein [Mucilaginibacter sp.]|uniref:cysteine hydrolase family protein n=1 Tax=Mucilaginibacter sp. TaxID=1882438 RepID=UPI003D0EC353
MASKKGLPALILVDIQKGFIDEAYWGGKRNNPGAEQNAKLLLDHWRLRGFPVYHIQHCSSNPDSLLAIGNPGNEIQDIVKPRADEPVITKSVNSAFIGTDLKDRLDNAGTDTVVIIGLTTDHCVSTTTRMAGNFGYNTYLATDAVATFPKKGVNNEIYDAELMHQTALASLNEEFATVLNTADIISLFK